MVIWCLSIALFFVGSTLCRVSFEDCDRDDSRLLTRIELRECFEEEYGPGVMHVDQLVQLFDRDGDGGISMSEYRLVLENMRDTTLDGEVQNDGEVGEDAFEEVDIEMRDGTVRTMHRDDFFEMNQARIDEHASQQGVSTNDGQNINTLKMKNPELGRFIELAEWAKGAMEDHWSTFKGNKGKDAHFPANSTIYELRSLPRGGSINRGKEKDTEVTTPSLSGKFDIYFEMSIIVISAENASKKEKTKSEKKRKESSVPKGKPADMPLARSIRKYEFHILGDPAVYRLPHAIVSACWELGDHGLRIDKLSVPEPRLYPKQSDGPATLSLFALVPALWSSMSNQQRLVAILGALFMILMILFFVLLPALNFLIVLQIGKDSGDDE